MLTSKHTKLHTHYNNILVSYSKLHNVCTVFHNIRTTFHTELFSPDMETGTHSVLAKAPRPFENLHCSP